jgi:hypothetical protein
LYELAWARRIITATNSVLLSTSVDAVCHINPLAASEVEIYYSGPPGDEGRLAFGLGTPLYKKGAHNIFNGQIVAGREVIGISDPFNFNADHTRIVEWYANTGKAISEKNSFTAGLRWSILSPNFGDFKTGLYEEIGYNKGAFSSTPNP